MATNGNAQEFSYTTTINFSVIPFIYAFSQFRLRRIHKIKKEGNFCLLHIEIGIAREREILL